MNEIDGLTDSLIPIVSYPNIEALAAKGVEEVLNKNIEAEQEAGIEALEDASDDG